MKKSELRTGMVVVNRDGEKLIVLKNVHTNEFRGDCIVQTDMKESDFNRSNWDDLNNYDEDLVNVSCPGLSIVKILVFDHCESFFNFKNPLKVLWERPTDDPEWQRRY